MLNSSYNGATALLYSGNLTIQL